MNALPAAPAIGSRVTARVYPWREFRRRPVTVTGRVTAVHTDSLTVLCTYGCFTVRAMDARRAR